MRVPVPSAALILLALLAASPAVACEARAKAGEMVTGPVLAVPAAGMICVALGPKPEDWVLVRLGGGVDRRTLMAAVFAKRVDCVIGAAGRGRCSLEGADIVALSQTPTILKAAADWR